ncbi:MAG: cytochrome c biogenesis CcdA family protein [Anaerostipes sp.]|jgi:cytochrome c-type biogenesis protein|nr:cytochrome c biogenesis protein CcdA [Anaerostipes sp.]
MFDTLLQELTIFIQHTLWFSPILALFAGMLTSVTPCSLSTLSLIMGYVTSGGENDTKKSFVYSFIFAIGSAVTFVTLGIAASFVGGVIGHNEILHVALCLFMILMAFQVWGIINIIPHVHFTAKNQKRGYIGAFVAGMLGGIFSSHCAVPVIVGLLAIVANEGNILLGILLLFCYSVGHGILAVVAGTSTAFAEKIGSSKTYTTGTKVFQILLGILMVVIGVVSLFLD